MRKLQSSRLQLSLELCQGAAELPCGLGEGGQVFSHSLGLSLTLGQGHGIVSGLGKEGSGLLQVNAGVGQLAQGILRRQSLGVDLLVKTVPQGTGGGVGHFLQGAVQFSRGGGQLGKGVMIGIGKQTLGLQGASPLLDGHPQDGDENDGQTGGERHTSTFFHENPSRASMTREGNFMRSSRMIRKDARSPREGGGGSPLCPGYGKAPPRRRG